MVETLIHIGTLLPTVFWFSAISYGVITGAFIILENKSPTKTLAWLLAFLALPVVGVAIYFLFGREYRPFSRERKLMQQELGNHLTQNEEIYTFLQNQPDEIQKLIDRYPLVYDRVLELIRRNLEAPLYTHNGLEILLNAEEKYPRLLEDIKAAQHSIHMEYFEWASDTVMQEFKTVLIAKAQAGVQVRVLYDPLGSFSMLSWRYVREMNAGGVQMLPWSSLLAVHTISYRSHRKIVVIDGKIGYTGGLNMSEEYVKGPHGGAFDGWRDTHVRVTGQVVLGLQAGFTVQWYNTTKEQLTDMAYFPPVERNLPYLPMHIVHSGPDADWKAIRSVYFALITAAQKQLYIQSPFFILDEGIAEAIAGAARSGVDVKIMLAPRGPGMQAPYHAAMTFAENMADAGVEIYFYEGAYFHAKTISVDAMICSIGSTNMDIRSFAINYELNLVIYDVETTRKLDAIFHEDLNSCSRFDVEAYKKSNVLLRTRDSVMRLLSPLM
ncbi:MAG: cardiolipin synthase [Caldilineaceae bacterium]|nr:cardiolipin synthase [Caldilineaceae bacterium]